MNSLKGTPIYLAPELYKVYKDDKDDENFTYKPKISDAFSLGIILLQIILVRPVSEIRNLNLNNPDGELKIKELLKETSEKDPFLTQLVWKCLRHD